MKGEFEKPAYLHSSLRLLTDLLFAHFGIPVVVFIDEYDVPLEKAYQNGYYPEMVNLLRSCFQVEMTRDTARWEKFCEALKTGDACEDPMQRFLPPGNLLLTETQRSGRMMLSDQNQEETGSEIIRKQNPDISVEDECQQLMSGFFCQDFKIQH